MAANERSQRMGANIKSARLDKRWKQKQLAAAVNVEPMTVSRWERGANMPDLDTLALVAQALGRPMSFFVGDPAAEPVTPSSGEDVVELLQEVRRLREEAVANQVEIRRQQELTQQLLADVRSLLAKRRSA